MTSNRARHGLIQLPTIFKVRPLLGTRRQSGTVPGTVPDLAGDGPGRSPVPVPDFKLAGTGTLPRPRLPSGGPRPGQAPKQQALLAMEDFMHHSESI